MGLPDVVIVLIGVVIAAAALVVVAMNRNRDHPLRDRFKEFQRKHSRDEDRRR